MSHFKTILSVFLLTSSFAWSQSKSSGSGDSSGSSGIMRRATLRESKRWTLQEWMTQKNNNALMDQWLMMNSPSPFEFMLGAGSLDYKTRIDSPFSENTFQSSLGEFAAYAQAVGLSLEYENNIKEKYNDVSGLLNLRVLGNSLQTTSMTLSAGQRTRTLSASANEIKLINTLAQIKIQAYLTKYFGLDGYYRSYLATDDATLGQVTGSRAEAGLFIDYKAFRIYGSWFQDIETDKSSTTSQETKRTGVKSGIKIFF